MITLSGPAGARITPRVGSGDWDQLFIRTDGDPLVLARGDTFDPSELLMFLSLEEDVPKTVRFTVVDVEGGLVSEESDPVDKIITLRVTDVAQPPPKPVLDDVEIVIPVDSSDPTVTVTVEVTNP